MAKQTLNKGSSANDGNGDTLRQGAQKINENFTELYDLLGATSGTFSSGVSFDSDTNGIQFTGNTNQTFLVPTDPTADRTITLPDLTGTVSLITATETLTNKTLTTPQINDTSSDHQYVVAVSELAADRNVTLPLLTGDDEFTFNSHAQTLTNKTLTTPAITSPKITTSINDTNGAEVIEVPATTNADNHLKISNADGASPTIESVGANDNVGLNIGSKGTGLVTITTGFAFGDGTEQGASGTITLLTPTTVFNIGTNFTANLPDGTVQGQIKILINKDTGVGTITPTTVGNFGFGTQISLSENQTSTLIWDGDDWQLISTYGGTVT